ncbi:MAG: sulfotransferase [candidate division KSB1 bacterium]|nr:sulfotransferase [candidate division KSB1 bacterium]MDZ7301503.1 sulfotransferase [candidate division KSB1 bacterium]MDZ7310905.1 sulfotransferase [candidate division KSB1 bacterium]
MFKDWRVGLPAPPVSRPVVSPQEKIDLIYIVGCGRSGSTLLDLVLGSHPAIISIGEVWYHGRWQANNFTCTCGAPFDTCEFWRAVMTHLRQQQIQVAVSPVSDPLQKLFASLQIYTGLRLLSQESIQQYSWASYQLFKAVRDVSGKPIVLDSSKNPLRLFYLCLSGYFNVKIIHLVRDGRAFLNSTSKRMKMSAQGDDKWMLPLNAWRASYRWILMNTLSSRLRKLLPATWSCQIKYEEFAAAPVATIQRLCDFLQIDYCPGMLKGAQVPHHNISGSRWRFQKDLVIRLDETWRTELSRRRLLTFKLLAQWLNHRFGYQ